MTRKDSLNYTLTAVKVGALPEAVFHGSSSISGHWAYKSGLDELERRQVFLAYNGSLDAVLALHNSLLPGWSWDLSSSGEVSLWPPDGHKMLEDYTKFYPFSGIYSENQTFARAWLIAILEALLWECNE